MRFPYIEKRHHKKVLMVHERPFLMLAGEVHNSNASDASYMEAVWKQADELGMNSLLLPVSWELTEPEENVFDFTLVDALITQARKYGKKIGFLWFGAWKNAQCYYAPSWVKKDLKRFWRAQVIKEKNQTTVSRGMTYTTLSAFCRETMKADAKAFSKLMAHIREVDEAENTVICVQVENETGILGGAREQSELAQQLYAGAVPEGLLLYLREHERNLSPELSECFTGAANFGDDWKTVFGSMAEEAFSAYYTASFVNFVAEAGKKEYPLPMTVNCWLDKGQDPGRYPSGGPVSKVMEIWQYAAPAIDMIAPDIYVPYFCDVCREYTRNENPLFIAECATHSYAGIREIYAVGHHHAVCYSPFGFEDMGKPFNAIQGVLFGMDTGDEALKIPQDTEEYAQINRILGELAPYLGEKYGTNKLQGAISECKEENRLIFEKFSFEVVFTSPFIRRKNGACLILQTTEDEFYAVLCGCALNVTSLDKMRPNVDFLCVEEGAFEDGVWKAGRRLNGDEITLMMFETPVLLRIKVFAYE